MPHKSAKHSLLAAKILGGGAEIATATLAKVNRFALSPLSVEDVYVRSAIVAHSAIDRDNERFPETLLDEYAATLPGKGYFHNPSGHPGSFGGQRGPGQGLWFDATTADWTPAEFEVKTGEIPRLAPGKTMVKVLVGSFYVVRMAENEGMIKNIDAGVSRFISIGFSATGMKAVPNPVDESKTLFYEYVGPGEAQEASSVYLGAQPGASILKEKCAGCSNKSHNHEPEKTDEGDPMDENEKARMKALEDAKTAKEKELADIKSALGIGDGFGIEDAKAAIEAGKAYTKSLVSGIVHSRRLLGLMGDEADAIKSFESVMLKMPVGHLEAEEAALKKSLGSKGLDKRQIEGSDPNKGRGEGVGTKDLTKPENNEFI